MREISKYYYYHLTPKSLDFLESQTQLWKDEYLKTICAFANSDGGVFYIGICDDVFVESWGKGTNNIVDDCLRMNLSEPEYRYSFGAVQVSLCKTAQETTKEQILAILKADPKTIKQDLMEQLGKADGTIKGHLEKYEKRGFVGASRKYKIRVLEGDNTCVT